MTAARREQEAADSPGGGGRPVLAMSVQPPFTSKGEAGSSAAQQGSQQDMEQQGRIKAEAAVGIAKLPVAAAAAEREPETGLNQGHASSSGD